jgi:tRNA threonylcarbamoyladenosine biosynthesis protein TsaB
VRGLVPTPQGGTKREGPSLLLALESALAAPGVALLRNGELVGEIALPATRPVSEQLLPGIEALLALCGSALEEVDAFALSIGPGSFTGIRVGVATVKGLAFGGGPPVAAVSTLKALACAAGRPGDTVAAVLDARRGEVYAGAYELTHAEPSCALPDGLYGVPDLAARLPSSCLLVGDGASLYAEAWSAARSGKPRILSETLARPRASHVGRLGHALLAGGGGIRAEELVPRYLRRAEAEARRTGERLDPAPLF